MKIVTSIPDLRQEMKVYRSKGETVGLVPTMGALHEGHLSLVRLAREKSDRTVVSIFVNPKQFGPNEDFERYPRDLERDSALLGAAGADLVFAPGVAEVYPPGFSTTIHVAGASEGMEGARRPGHFDGVATVVARLFCLVLPDIAVFGAKDGQQVAVIRRLNEDLGLPLAVIVGETVREPDGLALSSRNNYLTSEERQKAPRLYQALKAGLSVFTAGERDATKILSAVQKTLGSEPAFRLDALDLVDLETMKPISHVERPAMLAIAAFIGRTRLIDNVRLP
jgi:pantoate--beta-alanine ligase